MGELGEYWREHRDYLKSKGISRSRPRKRATFVKFTKAFARAGFKMCSDWHWQIKIGDEFLNFWPSKSKWMFKGQITIGTHDEILQFVKSLTELKS